MSSVKSVNPLLGASSSTGSAANKRAADAGLSFGQTLQSIADRAHADAVSAAQVSKSRASSSSSASADKTSVHDAPKADDKAAKPADDASSAPASSTDDNAKTADADTPKAATNAKPAQASNAPVQTRPIKPDTSDDASELAELSDAATPSTAAASASASELDTDKPAHKTDDAKTPQDALQAALAMLTNAPSDAGAAAAASASASAGSAAAASKTGKGEDAQGVVFGDKGGKESRVAGLLNAASTDAKADAAAANAVQSDATSLVQTALTPVSVDVTAAYKQAADAAANAVAQQSAAGASSVSNGQGAASAATSAAIAPHVAGAGWDDAFSQKVVFLSNSKQTSAELTLNPKDLGPIQVTLQVSDNHAHALFVSQHAQVREAVEAAMPKLREAFEANGISLGSASVSDGAAFSRQGSSSSSSSQQQQQGASSGRGGAFAGGGDAVGSSVSLPVRRTVGLVDTFA